MANVYVFKALSWKTCVFPSKERGKKIILSHYECLLDRLSTEETKELVNSLGSMILWFYLKCLYFLFDFGFSPVYRCVGPGNSVFLCKAGTFGSCFPKHGSGIPAARIHPAKLQGSRLISSPNLLCMENTFFHLGISYKAKWGDASLHVQYGKCPRSSLGSTEMMGSA